MFPVKHVVYKKIGVEKLFFFLVLIGYVINFRKNITYINSSCHFK
jgi:hypothetical protein